MKMRRSSLYLIFGPCLLVLTRHVTLTSSCPQPALVQNADLTPVKDGQDFQPGDTVAMKCREGYILDDSGYDYDYDYDYDLITVDSMTLTCGQDNTWSGTFAACQEFTCDIPVAPSRGSIILTRPGQTTFREGDRVHFQCDPGLDLIGRRSARCSVAAFGWTNEPPKCTKPVCPTLAEIERGRIAGSLFEVGATLTFHCADGYVLRGSPNRTCLHNRRWSGDVAICDNGDSDCGNPGIPDGGYKRGTHYNVGNIVTFDCEDGFSLFGDATRTCLRNKRWSGQEVRCEAPYAFDSATYLGQQWRATADILGQETETSVIIKNKVRVETENRARHLDERGPIVPALRSNRNVHLSMFMSAIHKAPFRDDGPRGHTRASVSETSRIPYTGGLDVYFLFDVSGSIEPEDFQKEIDFAATLIVEWGVSDGNQGTKVAALTFNSSAHLVFHTSEMTSEERAIAALRKVSPGVGGGTNVAAALREVRDIMIPMTEGRFPDRRSKTVIIIITDGLSNMGGNPRLLAKQLKDKDSYGAEIFCIGITRQTNRDKLKILASDPSDRHVFVTDQPNEFKDVIIKMRNGQIDYSKCGRAGDTDLTSYTKAVGGASAKKGAWPWMTGIYFGQISRNNIVNKLQHYQLFCGGTLIDPRWVLTAAHCTYSPEKRKVLLQPDQLLTVIGTNVNPTASAGGQTIQLSPSAEPIEVERIYRHVSFNYSELNLDGDIALLKLRSPAILSPQIRTACLPAKENQKQLYEEGQFGVVTGWGHPDPASASHLNFHGSKTVRDLRQIEIEVQSATTCDRSLRRRNYTHVFSNNMFCAGDTSKSEIRQDSCRGDSGGPFVVPSTDQLTNQVTWTLTGVVSWGIGCAQDDHYGFYTRVDRYLDWIRTTIGN